MENTQLDSISCGTSATGGAVKIYFDFSKETEAEIEAKADFCVNLAQKLKIIKQRFGA